MSLSVMLAPILPRPIIASCMRLKSFIGFAELRSACYIRFESPSCARTTSVTNGHDRSRRSGGRREMRRELVDRLRERGKTAVDVIAEVDRDDAPPVIAQRLQIAEAL